MIICDTAGRLHNKKNLMEELKKINRIIDKEYPEAYRENLIVLDATTGQNALEQAKLNGKNRLEFFTRQILARKIRSLGIIEKRVKKV